MTVRAFATLLLATLAFGAHAQAPRARIAYLSDAGGEHGIVVMNDDGTGVKRLTRGGTDTPPTWSPDGCSVVFRRGLNQIYIATLDGKAEQLVARTNADSPDNDLRSLYSPNGSQILLGVNDARFLVDARGEGVADFTGRAAPLFSGYHPAWSPDGKRIAYETRNAVHVINADGTGDVTLGPGRLPGWTQGGSRVTFLAQEGPATEPSFAIYKPSGAPQLMMTFRDKMPAVLSMSWSFDASKVAFVGADDDAKDGALSLYVMNGDGTGMKRLDNSLPPFTTQSVLPRPSWSPDGKRLAFSRANDVFAIDADGSHLTQLTHGGHNETPVWSPIPKCK